MPIVKLTGLGKEQWFALGRDELRRWDVSGMAGGSFSKTMPLGDATVRARQTGPLQYLGVTGGAGLSYEFLTTEHLGTSLATPGFPGYVAGSLQRVDFAPLTPKAKALYSSALTSAADPPAWTARAVNASQGTDDANVATRWSWQSQKFFEHCWHPRNDGKTLMTSTQAQAPGLANQANWMSPYCAPPIGNAGLLTADYGYDVIPALYAGDAVMRAAPQMDHSWAYWRRAAVRVVDGQPFVICTDNLGRFHVYKTGLWQDDIPLALDGPTTGKRIVPRDKVVTVTPEYPAWVTVPDPADYRNQVSGWLWRFNKDATRCATIAFSSSFTSGFYKYLGVYTAALDPAGIANSGYADAYPPAARVPAREDVPGLVELGINIVVTDATDDVGFTVEFEVLRESWFGTFRRFFFDVAYAFPDVEHSAGDPGYVAEDTLLTAEIECKTPAACYIAAPGGNMIDAVKQLRSEIVLNANDADLFRTELLRFPANGLSRMQFPTLAGYQAGYTGPVSGDVPTASGTINVPAAGPTDYNPDMEPGTYGSQIVSIFALELATRSILYQIDYQVPVAPATEGKSIRRGLAYGEEFYRIEFPNGYTKTDPGYPPVSETVPSARIHQHILFNTLNTEWGQGFNVHPHGHWSLHVSGQLASNATAAEALDWISVRKKVDGAWTRVRYRHRDFFNATFGQDRARTYYVAAYPYDHGSFRSTGFWITFR